MSRWSAILTFTVGFLLAYGGTAVFGYLGESPWWLWLLFTLFGFWLWQLPDLKAIDPRLTVLAAYGFTFLFLWLSSNPEPSGTIKTFVFQMVVGAMAIAAIAAVIGMISIYRKQESMRSVIAALCPLLIVCWMVAFFSSSTGAASHMVASVMRLLSLDQADAQTVVQIIRKSLHFLFYGTFGLLGFRAAVRGGAANKAVLLGLMVVLMHASFDEIRQSGYANRTGSFWDVCLDMAGATCFVLAGATVTKRRGLRASKPARES
jgi:VanZ family protein